eukprot:UN09285
MYTSGSVPCENNPGVWFQIRAIQLTGQFLLGPYGWEKTVSLFFHEGFTHETIQSDSLRVQYAFICFAIFRFYFVSRAYFQQRIQKKSTVGFKT